MHLFKFSSKKFTSIIAIIAVIVLCVFSASLLAPLLSFAGCSGAAVILFGTTVNAASGKVGGTVFSTNRNGPIIRGHKKPINPRTDAQVSARASMKFLAESWGQLGAPAIAAWNDLGNQITKSGRLGHKHKMTGEDLYIALNRNLQAVGQAYISAAPAISANDVQQTISWVPTITAGVVSFAWTGSLTANTAIEFEASGNMSGGRKYNSKWAIFNSIIATTSTPMVMTPAYIAKFGVVAAAGQVVFFRWRTIDIASGFASGWNSAMVIAS